MNAYTLLSSFLPLDPTPDDREITHLTESSLQADANSVFVCIAGATANGHAYAPAAYQNGCRFFVAEEPISLPTDACVCYVKSTRRTLSYLADRFYGHPSQQLVVIGITGTKGKTTTARLIQELLNREGISCGYIGTNGITYGDKQIPTKNTTPDAVTLQKTLFDMHKAGMQAAVLEISSQALAQYRADGTSFRAVLFTNLSSDHIGKNEHTDLSAYRAAKKRLFTDFEAAEAFCNADDPATEEMVKDFAASVVRCSTQNPMSDFYAADCKPSWEEGSLGMTFTLCKKGHRYPCRLPLIGTANAENALLAIATVSRVFSISVPQLVSHLTTMTVEGRSECIPLPTGAFAIIDYAHNKESLYRLLTALRAYNPRRLLLLFGSVGERTQARRAEMGEVAAALCDCAILTSDNPAHEDPNAIIADIAKAFSKSSTPYLAIPDRKAAILKAASMTQEGDFLVLAGKGHESYQLIGNEKIPFSEAAILQEACRTLPFPNP